jgi:hypothetical protein
VFHGHVLRTAGLQPLGEFALYRDAHVGKPGHAPVTHTCMSDAIRCGLKPAPAGAAKRSRQPVKIAQQPRRRNVAAFGNRALRHIGESASEARIARCATHEICKLRGDVLSPRIPFVGIVARVTLAFRFRQCRMHCRKEAKDFARHLRRFHPTHLSEPALSRTRGGRSNFNSKSGGQSFFKRPER